MVDWRRKQGKATEKEVGEGLKYLKDKLKNFWYWRVMDYRIYKRIDKNLFAPKTPCDYFACFRGKFYALEVKSSHSPKRYGLQYVKQHQKDSLSEIEKAGGEGWILLSWRRWNFKPKRKSNRLFVFRISDWLDLERETYNSGFKSVDWGTIIQKGMEIKRDKTWKLGKIFGVYGV